MFSRERFLEIDVFDRFPISRPRNGWSFDYEYMDGFYDEIALESPYSGFVGFGKRCVGEMAWFKVVITDEQSGFLTSYLSDIGLGDCLMLGTDNVLIKGNYCGDEGIAVRQRKGQIVCFSDDLFALTIYEDSEGFVEMVGFDNLNAIVNNCRKKSAKSVVKQLRLQEKSWRQFLEGAQG